MRANFAMNGKEIAALLQDLLAGEAGSAEEITEWGKRLTELADRAYLLARTGNTGPEAVAVAAELRAALAPVRDAPVVTQALLDLVNARYRDDARRLDAARRLLVALEMRPTLPRAAILLEVILELHTGKRKRAPALRLGVSTLKFQARLRREIRTKTRKDHARIARGDASVERIPEVGPLDLALLFTIATPREAELAKLLQKGCTLGQAAKVMGVRQSTLRELLASLRLRCG